MPMSETPTHPFYQGRLLCKVLREEGIDAAMAVSMREHRNESISTQSSVDKKRKSTAAASAEASADNRARRNLEAPRL